MNNQQIEYIEHLQTQLEIYMVENRKLLQKIAIMEEQTCATCKWWTAYKTVPSIGLCSNETVDINTCNANCNFAFNQNFGCRFHEDKT